MRLITPSKNFDRRAVLSIGEKAGDIEKQGDKFVFVSRMRNLPLLEKVEDSNGKIIRIRVAR